MKASVADLARLPGVWRGGQLDPCATPVVPTGHAELDAELPGGGWPVGTLTEVLHDSAGIGEVSFLASVLKRRGEAGRLIAWIAPPYLPYAPAIIQAGIPAGSCLVVSPATREDALWAAEQALHSGACGAVLLWLAPCKSPGGDFSWLRRLQIAAQASATLAVLYRNSSAEGHASPAHLRAVLTHEGGSLRIRIPKRRGPPLARKLPIPRISSTKRRSIPCSGSPSNFPPSRCSSSSAGALFPVR